MTKLAALAAAALLLLPALAISAATGDINLSTPSSPALADIPPDYLLLYQQAGLAFDIPWEVLAAVGKVECDHGRYPDPACRQHGVENHAGAGGPMQFLAGTWARYGIDANQDGVADRWNPADAIVSAANYLAASGAPGDLEAALYAYNPSRAYVAEVLSWAEHYQQAADPQTGEPIDLTSLPDRGDPAALAAAILNNPNLEPQTTRILDAGEQLVAQSQIQCQAGTHAPLIGHVKRNVVVVQRVDYRSAGYKT